MNNFYFRRTPLTRAACFLFSKSKYGKEKKFFKILARHPIDYPTDSRLIMNLCKWCEKKKKEEEVFFKLIYFIPLFRE